MYNFNPEKLQDLLAPINNYSEGVGAIVPMAHKYLRSTHNAPTHEHIITGLCKYYKQKCILCAHTRA